MTHHITDTTYLSITKAVIKEKITDSLFPELDAIYQRCLT